MGLRIERAVLAANEGLENATLEYNRTSSAPLQEEVLVAVLTSRYLKEVRTYLHVQVWKDTARLSLCDSCFMTIFVLVRRGKHHAQKRQPKRILQTLCRWMSVLCTVKVARARKARAKASSKVTETDTMPKVKANSQ